jgi:glycosyltransferase involved in cell wall biosynthesis
MDFQKFCESRRDFTILYVVDSVFWITGVMAKEMAKKTKPARSIICAFASLKEILKENNDRFPLKVDLVHFLISEYANAENQTFREESAIVSSILHVEQDSDMKPLEYSDSIMTMSEEWQEHVSARTEKPENVIKVPVGIDFKTFYPAKERTQVSKIRKKYGIPDDAFVVGFSAKRSSNTSDRKGIDVLEKLIESSSKSQSKIWWAIRGPGWQDWVERLAGGEGRVTYIPFLLPGKEMGDSYRMLDAFICTSKIEGGPIPLLEAMATGLPCISTGVGYALDSIRDGQNGFLAPFGDADFFMEKIQLLQSSPAICSEIGSNARQTALDSYTWEGVLENLPELYCKAVDNFEIRKNGKTTFEAAKWKDFYKVKKHIEIQNHVFASMELQRIGAVQGGRYYATKGLMLSPLDPVNIRRFFFWTYFGWLYFKLLSIFSFFKKKPIG